MLTRLTAGRRADRQQLACRECLGEIYGWGPRARFDLAKVVVDALAPRKASVDTDGGRFHRQFGESDARIVWGIRL
jgi:hypothetical protein